MKNKLNIYNMIWRIVLTILSMLFILSLTGIAKAADDEILKTKIIKVACLKNTEQKIDEKLLNIITHEKTNLDSVVITELPDFNKAFLKLLDREVLSYQKITKDNLKDLSFIPAKDFIGTVEVGVKVNFKNKKEETLRIRFVVKETLNNPPVANNQKISTIKNIEFFSKLNAFDEDFDDITYKIIKNPKKGKIKFDKNGNFVYSPSKNRTGNDSFSYKAYDQFGSISETATVNIKIEKPSSPVFYTDLQGHPSHYYALKLFSEEILKGEEIGGKYFFRPNENVSRGEFLVMAMRALNLDNNLQETTTTNFADDKGIPAWIKPYLNYASAAGLINSSTEDQNVKFEQNKKITRAEAASIISNALQIYKSDDSVYFADMDNIPASSLDYITSLYSAGILNIYDDLTIRATNKLTRGDTAALLVNAANYKKEHSRTSIFNLFK